jgi:hypothetical protein
MTASTSCASCGAHRLLSRRSRRWRPRRVELMCQPGAEQRSGGRQTNCAWKHAGADVVAGEQARAPSMPSTTADASSQPRTGAPRFSAMSSPSPKPRSRAPTMRAKRRVPPSDPSPVIMRPTNPGANSDTTPMATLPPAKPTARPLPSIHRIVRDQRLAACPDSSPRPAVRQGIALSTFCVRPAARRFRLSSTATAATGCRTRC